MGTMETRVASQVEDDTCTQNFCEKTLELKDGSLSFVQNTALQTSGTQNNDLESCPYLFIAREGKTRQTITDVKNGGAIAFSSSVFVCFFARARLFVCVCVCVCVCVWMCVCVCLQTESILMMF